MTTPTDKSASSKSSEESAKPEAKANGAKAASSDASNTAKQDKTAADADKAKGTTPKGEASEAKAASVPEVKSEIKTDQKARGAANNDTSSGAKSSSSGATTSAPPTPAAPAKKGGGIGIGWTVSMVIAAILGGAVVQYGFPMAGLAPQGSSSGRINALEATVATLQADLAEVDLGTLRQRVSEIEASVEVMGGAAAIAGADGAAPDPTGLADLRARLQATAELIGRLSSRVDAVEAAGVEGAVTMSADGEGLATGFVTQMQSDLSGIRSRVEALTSALNQRAAGLNDRVQALETTVPSDLLAQLGSSASKSDLDVVAGRLEILEKNTTALDAKRAAAAIALANLSRAAVTGQKFQRELDAVLIIDQSGDEISRLAQHASTGVRPASDLLTAFGPLAREALRESNRAGGNWWERMLTNLSNLFLIRRRDTVDGASVEAVLNRAQNAAEIGNLHGAVVEVDQLTGAPAEVMQEWLEQGKARVELDNLITALSTRLLQGLGD